MNYRGHITLEYDIEADSAADARTVLKGIVEATKRTGIRRSSGADGVAELKNAWPLDKIQVRGR